VASGGREPCHPVHGCCSKRGVGGAWCLHARDRCKDHCVAWGTMYRGPWNGKISPLVLQCILDPQVSVLEGGYKLYLPNAKGMVLKCSKSSVGKEAKQLSLKPLHTFVLSHSILLKHTSYGNCLLFYLYPADRHEILQICITLFRDVYLI
jgi:hypothetical protein